MAVGLHGDNTWQTGDDYRHLDCHLLLGETRQDVEGICGAVQDGVVPGLWGYEAGQAGGRSLCLV
jgi:hypothetical protein